MPRVQNRLVSIVGAARMTSNSSKHLSCRHLAISMWIALLPLVAFVSGCDRSAPAAKNSAETAVIVTLEPAQTRPVQRSVDVTGTLYGTEDATISAKVAGRVIAINADMGD